MSPLRFEDIADVRGETEKQPVTAPEQHPSTVEELNEALRLYRRTVLTVIALGVLGLPACWGLSLIGTWLKPPYGLYIYGESLSTWGLIAVVGLLIAQLW